jgi:ABC-type uncharacterized transport system fused permease/ATPase subunit
MSLHNGRVSIPKSNHQTAYCAQYPFLEHATIRENIIFGSPLGYDESRYKKVVEACALVMDLGTFEAGDRTGESLFVVSGLG